MTAVLHDLRQSLTLTREVYGRRSSQAERAFSLLARTAAANGTSLDALRHHVEDEVERFFSYTIPGPDGHVYWNGARDFRRNDGKQRRPIRWWWEHRNGTLAPTDDITVTCGEKNCVNPEHAAKTTERRSRMQWTEERIIGALQVAELRHGHTLSSTEWDRHGYRPVHEIITRRFGSWPKAIEAAGLPPVVRRATQEASRSQVIEGIRLVHRLLGKWPSDQDYVNCRTELHAAGLPSTPRPAGRLYGSFAAARVAAGGPESLRADGHARTPRQRATLESCLAAVRFVRDRIGRWPTKDEFMRENEALLDAGLPASETPFRRLFGSFVAGRAAAGGPVAEDFVGTSRVPRSDRVEADTILAGIRFVHERTGRWPSRRAYVAQRDALVAAGFPGSEGPAIDVFGSFTAAREAAGGPPRMSRWPKPAASPAESESSGSPRSES